MRGAVSRPRGRERGFLETAAAAARPLDARCTVRELTGRSASRSGTVLSVAAALGSSGQPRTALDRAHMCTGQLSVGRRQSSVAIASCNASPDVGQWVLLSRPVAIECQLVPHIGGPI